MNVGRTPTELYDEMQPDYSASGMSHLASADRLILELKNFVWSGSVRCFHWLGSMDP